MYSGRILPSDKLPIRNAPLTLPLVRGTSFLQEMRHFAKQQLLQDYPCLRTADISDSIHLHKRKSAFSYHSCFPLDA